MGTLYLNPWPMMSAARACRIYITQRSNGVGGGTTASGYMNLNLGLASVIGGPNICIVSEGVLVAGATGSVSSTYLSNNGSTAWATLRGDTSSSTYFHTGPQAAPWWASIDFGVGNTVSVAELFITPVNVAPESRTPYEFYFQTSPDAVNWTTVLYRTGITGWANYVEKAWAI